MVYFSQERFQENKNLKGTCSWLECPSQAKFQGAHSRKLVMSKTPPFHSVEYIVGIQIIRPETMIQYSWPHLTVKVHYSRVEDWGTLRLVMGSAKPKFCFSAQDLNFINSISGWFCMVLFESDLCHGFHQFSWFVDKRRAKENFLSTSGAVVRMQRQLDRWHDFWLGGLGLMFGGGWLQFSP